MSENGLDYFGKILISEVRDRTITNWDMILNGKMKGITAQKVREELSGFSDDNLEVLRWLIPKITDTSLHNLLGMVEQNNEIKIEIYDGEIKKDITQLSDGLEGELYTDDGWIKRFSKERYDEN